MFFQKSIWLTLCFLIITPVFSQSIKPFQAEIDAFKKQDSLQQPPQNPIVFAGSSSFRLWESMYKDFSGFPVLNRGFGGSTLLDLIDRLEETVLQYNPKQVVIYCGENDFAASASVTPAEVAVRFKRVYSAIRKRQGKKTKIIFISIKPSVARWQLESKFVAANELISSFLKSKRNTYYIDVHTPMLDPAGQVFPDLFIKDNLHMNAKGYAIWKELILPHLTL
ncbi:MAG: G-D-S-L family lipolytic protein [Bacteroidetes bacterium]|nr:G-D-S-L family lipolytic protein [Bacteroidota bacterium]